VQLSTTSINFIYQDSEFLTECDVLTSCLCLAIKLVKCIKWVDTKRWSEPKPTETIRNHPLYLRNQLFLLCFVVDICFCKKENENNDVISLK